MTRDLLQEKERMELAEGVDGHLERLDSHTRTVKKCLDEIRSSVSTMQSDTDVFDPSDATRVTTEARQRLRKLMRVFKSYEDIAGGTILISVGGNEL